MDDFSLRKSAFDLLKGNADYDSVTRGVDGVLVGGSGEFGVLDDVGSLEVVGNRGLTDAAAWAFVERLPGWPDSVRIEAN